MEISNLTEPGMGSDGLNCSLLLLSNDTVCMEHPEEMLKPWKTNPLFFEIIIVHVTTFVFGLCGNAVVIAVLAGNVKTRTATNSFLVSLAVGDLLMLCIYGPLETYTHFVMEWDENGAVCKTAKFAEFLSATSSVLNLLAVTVERFLVIVFPMKSRTFCTNSNTAKAIMVVWLLSVILASPIIFTTGTYKVVFTNRVTSITLNYCNHSMDSPAFAIYQFFTIFLIPGVIMIICYSLVIRELWASTRKIDRLTNGVSSSRYACKSSVRSFPTREDVPKQMNLRNHCVMSNKDEVNAARKQVIKMLISVIVLFYVSWGPRLTMDVLQKLHMLSFTQNVYLIRIILNLITFFHGCINPFVYSFLSKNFRSSLLKHWQRCGGYGRASNWIAGSTRENFLTNKSLESKRSLMRSDNGKRWKVGETKYSRASFVSSETKSTAVDTVLLHGDNGSADNFSSATPGKVHDGC